MEKLPDYMVLDGGISTEIFKITCKKPKKGRLYGSHVLVKDEHVSISVHRNYLESGADMIETNTYIPTVELLMEEWTDLTWEEGMELLRKAAKIACEVRDEFWEKIKKEGTNRCRPLVIGAIASYAARTLTGDSYVGVYADTTPFDDIVRGHRDKTRALVEGGVDILGYEAMPAAIEGNAIAELLKEFPGSKAWLAFTCKDGKHTCHGEPFRDAAMTSLLSDQIVAVGVNCSHPENVTSLLKEIPVEVKEKKKIIVYPNNGKVYERKEKYWYGDIAKPLHEYVTEWIKHGANWIGGCCNTTPDDITKIRNVMDEYRKPI